jgi:predicted MFS family arabinose efflux permease
MAETHPGFKRTLALLTGCWSLVAISQMLVVSVSALVGQMLAEDKAFATVPIALQWAGVAACTVPASFFMARVGRRMGFVAAALVYVFGCALCVLAIYRRDFLLYCVGSVFLGIGQGFAWYYRFAAAEAVPEAWKSRAISLVLGGGVVSAVVGPTLADHAKDFLAPVVFAGTFATIGALQLVVIAILAFVRLPKPPAARFGAGRPMREIARQPKFVMAVVAGVVAYAGMVMLMSVTPLAMTEFCGLTFSQATTVIQWHVLGMYVPAFFTGHLIARYGAYPIMAFGGGAMAGCLIVALLGQTVWHFGVAQTLLGVGWNFLFVGATTVLTETYRPEERAKTQALNEFLIFVVTGSMLYLSGKLLNLFGWNAVNWGALPLVLIVLASTIYMWLKSRRRAVPAPAE